MRIKILLFAGFLLFAAAAGLFAGGVVEQVASNVLGRKASQAAEAEAEKVQSTEGSYEPSKTPAAGNVSITGDSPLIGGDPGKPFFQEKKVPRPGETDTSRVSSAMLGRGDTGAGAAPGTTAPGMTAPGNSGSASSGTGSDDGPKFHRFSAGGAAGILYLFGATEPANGIFSAAVDWAPIPHLALGFKFGISMQAAGGQIMVPEVSGSYFFSSTGLQGLYTGMTAAYTVSSMGGVFLLSPQIGYRLVLFGFLAIDGKFGYTVMPQPQYHGPMATISSGYSF